MRFATLILLFLPGIASAQLTEAEKKAALEFILPLRDPASGAFKADAKSATSLRATFFAVRIRSLLSTKTSSVAFPFDGRTAEYVLSCYDAATGGFHEPDGQPDLGITCTGLLAAAALAIPEEKYPKGVDYLKANAKSFEDVRMGAAALESLKKKPEWLGDWIKIADAQLNSDGTAGHGDGQARDTASVAAMKLRLGFTLANKAKVAATILSGQRPDGGWGKAGAKGSDLESTYRVMRALHLLKEQPKDAAKINAFLFKCRNADGGYGVEPGNASTLSGVYFASAISKWMEK